MFDNEIDYGKLAFMRLEDVEAGLRITASRPRFSGVKVAVYPFADITNRNTEVGVFGAEGSVSILANVVLRLSEPVGGELELRINNMPAIVTGLEERQAGRVDIVLTGAVSVSGRDNIIALFSSSAATLISAEIMLFGEDVTCQSGAGINYACMDTCAVVLNIRDNRIYAQVFEDGRLTDTVRISRGISADVIADEGIFKVFFADDERNLWYCELIDNTVRNIRWLAPNIERVAVSQTEGDPLAVVTDGDGVVRFGYVRERLGFLRELDGAGNVRSVSCVKGTRMPRVIVTGWNGRSVVRTGEMGEEVGMGVVRGSVGYVIR